MLAQNRNTLKRLLCNMLSASAAELKSGTPRETVVMHVRDSSTLSRRIIIAPHLTGPPDVAYSRKANTAVLSFSIFLLYRTSNIFQTGERTSDKSISEVGL